MMRGLSLLAISAATLSLAACSAISKAPAGPLTVGNAQMTLGHDWNDVSAIIPARTNKVRVLSLDGPLLNRLYISDGLVPGESLIRAASKENPAPTIRKGMSASERLEFLADSVAAMGYQRVETARPRPVQMGAQPALRVDLVARTTDGLDIKGVGEIAEIGEKTYVLIYLAPAEHYYAASLAEVEKILASATLKR